MEIKPNELAQLISNPTPDPPPEVSDKERRARAADILLSQSDRVWKFEKHFFIKDDVGVVRPIENLNPIQLKVMKVMEQLRAENKPVRILVLKARQQGSSTIIEADMFDQVIENQIDALVIAHDKSTSEHIFNMTHRFYENFDLPKPEASRSGKWGLQFANHDGKISVETAMDVKAGTGRTAQYIHASESSKWERGDETALSLLQSIHYKPGTTLIHESTAYGYDELFQPMWQEAYESCTVTFDSEYNPTITITDKEKWNYYVPIFNAWFDHPYYTTPFEDEIERERFRETLSDYEQSLLDRFSEVTLEKLNWRRYIGIKHKCKGDLKKFKQEYPSTPEEAFIYSGRPRLNHEILDQMPVMEGVRGCLQRSENWDGRLRFFPDPQELMVKWKDPKPGHRYVIGVDTSEGKLDSRARNPDASVAIVLDLDANGEQVATLCGQIPEEDMVERLRPLGEYYNLAYMVIEANSTGKVVSTGMGSSYPKTRLYHRSDWDPEAKRHSTEVGWKTHVGTRNILVGKLAGGINDWAVILHDVRTVEECKRFVWASQGRVEAQKGFHDDHCMALGLAIVGMSVYPQDLDPFTRQSQMKHAAQAQRSRFKSRDPVSGY